MQSSKEDYVTFTNTAGNTPIQPTIATALISAVLHMSTLYWLEDGRSSRAVIACICAGRVLREIAKDVWAADRPFLWNGIDVGGPSFPAHLARQSNHNCIVIHLAMFAATRGDLEASCQLVCTTCAGKRIF